MRTPFASRTTSSPPRRTVSSTNTARSVSWPLTDGMATISRRRSISPGKVHPQIGGLLLTSNDHGPAAGAGENLQQECIGGTAIDDVGPLHSAGGGPDARLDLGSHATAENAVGHEAGQIIRVGEGDQGRRVASI